MNGTPVWKPCRAGGVKRGESGALVWKRVWVVFQRATLSLHGIGFPRPRASGEHLSGRSVFAPKRSPSGDQHKRSYAPCNLARQEIALSPRDAFRALARAKARSVISGGLRIKNGGERRGPETMAHVLVVGASQRFLVANPLAQPPQDLLGQAPAAESPSPRISCSNHTCLDLPRPPTNSQQYYIALACLSPIPNRPAGKDVLSPASLPRLA